MPDFHSVTELMTLCGCARCDLCVSHLNTSDSITILYFTGFNLKFLKSYRSFIMVHNKCLNKKMSRKTVLFHLMLSLFLLYIDEWCDCVVIVFFFNCSVMLWWSHWLIFTVISVFTRLHLRETTLCPHRYFSRLHVQVVQITCAEMADFSWIEASEIIQ